MNTKEITDRLELLHNALFEDTTRKESRKKPKKEAFFTVLERICINQERGYLFSKVSALETKKKPLKRYKISPEIELKAGKALQAYRERITDLNKDEQARTDKGL